MPQPPRPSGTTDDGLASGGDPTLAAPRPGLGGTGPTEAAPRREPSGSDPTEAAPLEEPSGSDPTAVASEGLATGARAMVARAKDHGQPAGRARYRESRLIGEGGMGRVIEAEDLQFGRLVALKEMRAAGGYEDRFGLEAVITANLEHPGIPAVYERGQGTDGKPFYAMRLIKGHSLSAAIRSAETLDEKLRLMPVILDVANTIAYAHEHGVIHRDLKPDNVVVGAHGDTVVVDWGLAKLRGVGELSTMVGLSGDVQSGATEHGSVLGTPSYMPPEQANGRIDEVDERSDVFSLGALIYQLFSGRAPYGGRTGAERVAKAMEGRPEPLAKLAPDTPEAVLQVVEKAMHREARDRFRNAGELARALEDLVARGLTAKEPKSLRMFADAVSWLFLLFTFGVSLLLVAGMAMSGQLQMGGLAAPVMLFSFVLGITTSGLDYRTRGKHELSPLVLGMAGMTIITAATFTVVGLMEVFGALQMNIDAGNLADDMSVLRGLSGGTRIALVPLMLGFPLFLAQLAIWLVVRRIVVRARARGLA